MLRIKKKLATLPLYIAVTCMPTCLFETRQNQTVLLSPRLTFSYVLWMTNLEGVRKRYGLETRLDYEYPEGLTVLHAGTDMILQNSFWRAVSLIVLTFTRWLSISLCKALTKGCSLVQHWHTLKEVWHLCIWVWKCESVSVRMWECENKLQSMRLGWAACQQQLNWISHMQHHTWIFPHLWYAPCYAYSIWLNYYPARTCVKGLSNRFCPSVCQSVRWKILKSAHLLG